MRFRKYSEPFIRGCFGDLIFLRKEKYDPQKDTATYPCIELENIEQETCLLNGYFDSKKQKSIKTKFQSGDVLFGKLRPYLRKYALVDFNGVCSTEIWALYSNKLLNSYLFYYIQTEQFLEVANTSSGTKMPRAEWNLISSKEFRYPQSREEMGCVSHFLSKIDQRIETQSKIIEDIETLRKWIINQQFTRTATNAIGEFIEQTSERNKINCVDRVLSVSNKYGFINQSEQFEDREVASDNRTNYKIVRRNDFAFNPARINVGSIAKLDTYDIGIVSPMYICFKSNNKNLDVDYLSNFFSSNSFKNALNKRLEGSVRQCLQFDALCDIKLIVPSLDEQIFFVSKIKAITKKLAIEKDILSAYKKQKAYLLSNMFI